jgi:hypothetical protein
LRQNLLPRCHRVLEEIRASHGCTVPDSLDIRLAQAVEQIFILLKVIPLNEIQMIGKRFSEKQMNLLSGSLGIASGTRVLARLSVLFFHYRRREYERAVHYLSYAATDDGGHAEFALWLTSQERAMDDIHGWIRDYFSKVGAVDRTAFLESGFKTGMVRWKDFQRSAPSVELPFFYEMMDLIFDRGYGTMISSMPAEALNQRALVYLEQGDNPKLIEFLRHVSIEKWQPEIVEGLYRRWGKPDPGLNTYYGKIEKGTLWGFREKLFLQKLPLLEIQESRKTFWKNWIHHCDDVSKTPAGLCFSFGQMDIIEEKDFSNVVYAGKATDKIRINFGPDWEDRLNQVLNEYLY